NRPTRSTPFPEVNEVYAHHARHGKDRGSGCGRGRGRDHGQERNHVPDFYEHPKGKIDHLIGDGSVKID
ncbi:hypothetical protein HAX54_014341, partial [Datura stramonium]|nr:hypothetical protein [Datura stramonium]